MTAYHYTSASGSNWCTVGTKYLLSEQIELVRDGTPDSPPDTTGCSFGLPTAAHPTVEGTLSQMQKRIPTHAYNLRIHLHSRVVDL